MSAFPKIEGKHHKVENLRGKFFFFFWHDVFLKSFYRKISSLIMIIPLLCGVPCLWVE